MSNQLTEMAREILAIEADLPFHFLYDPSYRTTVNDFKLYTFEQVWGSTALGFSGWGGDTVTTARTYVFVPESSVDEVQQCHVYFGGRHAYSCDNSEVFMEDVRKQAMASVYDSVKYRITKSTE